MHYRRRKQRRIHGLQRRRNQETSYLVGRGDCYEDGNEMEELGYANICEMIIGSESLCFNDHLLHYTITYVCSSGAGH